MPEVSLPTVAALRASKPWLEPKVTLTDADGQERVIYALQPQQLRAFNLTPVHGPTRRQHTQKRGYQGPVHIGYGGAGGGGKSYWARVVATAVAFAWPGSTSVIFRETESDVKRNHVERFFLEVPQYFNGQKLYSYNGTDMCVTWFNGSKTYFGYLKYDHDVRRWQGIAIDCMIFEEATHYSWFQVQWLTGNRLRSSVEGTVPFACYPSNPGGRGHPWFKRLFIQRRYRGEERPREYDFIQALLKDNIELMRRDPSYARKLDLLPEPHRSWQRDGNFAAGAGSALAMIDWQRHLCDPFAIPPTFSQFGSYDWGYAHPFAFGHYAVSEDGMLYKITTVTGVRLLPHQQAERILSRAPVDQLDYICAGHDAWTKVKARGEDTPSIAEVFEEYGIYLTRANIDRKQGLQAIMRALDWETSGPWIDGKPTEGDPRLRFFDNEHNRKALEQLETMVEDPDDPEDVLKVDADEFGDGGDDIYDETRYACASRPRAGTSTWEDAPLDAWSPDVLAHEAHLSRLVKRPKQPDRIPPDAVV